MKFEGNLSMTEIIFRFFLGLFLGIAGGFLGHYVGAPFFVIMALAPVSFLTAILGWCPLYEMMHINHAK